MKTLQQTSNDKLTMTLALHVFSKNEASTSIGRWSPTPSNRMASYVHEKCICSVHNMCRTLS